jgi:hypothetical protein
MDQNVISINVVAKDMATSVFRGINKNLKKDLGTLNSQLSNVGGNLVRTVGSMASGVLGAVINLAKKATFVIGGLAGSFVAFGIHTAIGAEQVKVALTTMLGSADEAGKLLSDLADFAAETPFELVGLQKSTKRLLAYGFSADEVIDKLKMIGDVSAGVGANVDDVATIFGRAKNAGQIFTMELDQLTDRGIPILNELAQIMGVAQNEVRGLAAEGIKFEDINQAFINMTSDGGKFFNLMEDQSKTAGGMISNLKDNFTVLAMEIAGIDKEGNIKPGGLFDRFKNILAGVNEFLEKNKERIIELADQAMSKLGEILKNEVLPFLKEFAQKFVDDILPNLINFGEYILTEAIPAIARFLGKIAEFVTDPANRSFIENLIKMAGLLAGAAGLAWAIGVAQTAILAFTSPLGVLVATAVAGVAAFEALKKPVGELFVSFAEGLGIIEDANEALDRNQLRLIREDLIALGIDPNAVPPELAGRLSVIAEHAGSNEIKFQAMQREIDNFAMRDAWGLSQEQMQSLNTLLHNSGTEWRTLDEASQEALTTIVKEGVEGETAMVKVKNIVGETAKEFDLATAAATGLSNAIGDAYAKKFVFDSKQVTFKQGDPGLMRFATGGVVPGNNTQGDNVLARVNSGEMILNKGQQQNLFDMIKGGGGGGAQNVTININGGDTQRIVQVIEDVLARQNINASRGLSLALQ